MRIKRDEVSTLHRPRSLARDPCIRAGRGCPGDDGDSRYMREFKLYPFQQAVFNELLVDLLNKKNSLVQLPTGSGKTHLAAYLAKVADNTVWFICHRRELIEQAARVFEECGVSFGIVSAGGATDPDARVQICSVGSLPRLKWELRRPEIIIVDECHHLAARTWHKIAIEFDDAVLVGLTATPYRLDGAALDLYFSRIIAGPTVRELIEQGFLSDYDYYAPSRPDLAAVKINRGGEYDRDQIETVMRNDVIVGDVIDHYQRLANGRKAIVYAVSVDASINIAARFNAAGVPAAHIDGATPEQDRRLALSALASGEIKILSNVELFTEGLDAPDIGAVILMRPTRSLGLARQMIGRGMRASHEKLVILDHVNLFAEFGTPDYEFEWRLDGKPPKWFGEGHKRGATAGRVLDGGAREIEYVPGFLDRIVCVPDGCVTKAEFANMIERTRSSISLYINKGMPTYGGFINIKDAMLWLDNERKESISRLSARGRLANSYLTQEQRVAAAKKICDSRTPEKNRDTANKMWNSMSAGQRSARVKERMSLLTPEQRSASAKKSAETRRAKRQNELSPAPRDL